ncbi:uncharacterized protein F4812DRAFT_459693 [Daldinia caldariorum]|uniref:uncharacterized protein n=1 Tax=Daldinia caldariorum TaxID=326644 RepID=UPI0020084D4C|nr:uncharacterized protein F4812DRAFT_459693 [Daldinia caldariorum]KAI1467586.1 hypothetical protein F4812DRAFT_459693 [Daldinia caldariorum]
MDTTKKTPAHVPKEIIFQIMSSLLPADKKTHIPPWHDGTQLLLAFSRVSHATHDEATRILKQHCIFISVTRARRFVRSLNTSLQSKYPLPSAFTNIERMYVNIIGDESMGRVLDIFDHVGASLRSLTLDHYSTEIDLDPSNQPNWRRCFKKLTQLEELACTIDILLMACDPHNRDTGGPLWPNLKRLGIIKYYIGFDLSWLFAQSRQLSHIVLRKAVNPRFYLQILPQQQEEELSYELPDTLITVAISENEDQSIQEQYAEDDRLHVLKYALRGKRSYSEMWWQAVLGGKLWELGLPGSSTEAQTEAKTENTSEA